MEVNNSRREFYFKLRGKIKRFQMTEDKNRVNQVAVLINKVKIQISIKQVHSVRNITENNQTFNLLFIYTSGSMDGFTYCRNFQHFMDRYSSKLL